MLATIGIVRKHFPIKSWLLFQTIMNTRTTWPMSADHATLTGGACGETKDALHAAL